MYEPIQPYPEARAYVDTVEVSLREKLTKPQRQEIRGHISAGHFGNYRPQYRKHGFRLRFHQPAPQGIAWLDQNARLRGWRLMRIEAALDVPTKKPAPLERWILEHLVQPHRRHKKRTNRYRETTYSGRRLDARNIATYSDKPSKVTGGPCVHIELRLRRTITLRRAGIFSIASIAELDVPALLQRHIQFKEFGRVGSLLARSIREYEDDDITAMAVQRACNHHQRRPERILWKVDAPFIWPATTDRRALLHKPKRRNRITISIP